MTWGTLQWGTLHLIHREIKPHLAEVQKAATQQTQEKTTTLSTGQNNEADFTVKTKNQQNKKSIIAQTGSGRWYEREKISVVNSQDCGILGAGNQQSPDMMTTPDTNQATISSDMSENGFLRSLPVSSPKSIEEAVVSVNPHFADNVPEYQNNCGNCTVAYDMQRRGYDVEAMPALHM